METDTLFQFAVRGMKAQAAVNKLCRTENPQTSKDAAKRMVESGELNRQEKEVYDLMIRYDKYQSNGFTTKNIAAYMNYRPYYKAYDICRKRFSGLERKGKIELVQTGVKVINPEQVPSLRIVKPVYKRRDGCRVWRLK